MAAFIYSIHSIMVYLRTLSLAQTVQRRRIIKGCSNFGRQVARAAGFSMMVTNICGPHYGTLYATFLVLTNLRWLIDFWKTCAPLG
jgi:hypothetical protein